MEYNLLRFQELQHFVSKRGSVVVAFRGLKVLQGAIVHHSREANDTIIPKEFSCCSVHQIPCLGQGIEWISNNLQLLGPTQSQALTTAQASEGTATPYRICCTTLLRPGGCYEGIIDSYDVHIIQPRFSQGFGILNVAVGRNREGQL